MKAYLASHFEQIANGAVDEPFSGFLVNQNIEETFDVLQYEVERASLAAGTHTFSLPSGLASNKQSVLFISANIDCTLAVVSRDYADASDKTLNATIRSNEPFYAVVHNIKSYALSCTLTTQVQSFCAKISPANAVSATSPNQGIDPGTVPVGCVIPISGTFSTPGAGYSETGILPLPSYLHPCDGTLITDSESIFYGKYAPNLTGNKTLFGASTAGTETSSSTNTTILTGFGVDWNIFQSIDVAAAYTVRYFMRIK